MDTRVYKFMLQVMTLEWNSRTASISYGSSDLDALAVKFKITKDEHDKVILYIRNLK